mgnify:CR=1 FL=1
MKRVIAILIVFLVIQNVSTNFGKSGDINIVVNGSEIIFEDAKPYINNESRTVIPIRFVAEALGAEVGWVQETKTVVISKDNITITLKINSKMVFINDEQIIIDTQAVINNSRTFVPLRFVSEAMNARVEWIGETKTVIIMTEEYYAKNYNQPINPTVTTKPDCAKLTVKYLDYDTGSEILPDKTVSIYETGKYVEYSENTPNQEYILAGGALFYSQESISNKEINKGIGKIEFTYENIHDEIFVVFFYTNSIINIKYLHYDTEQELKPEKTIYGNSRLPVAIKYDENIDFKYKGALICQSPSGIIRNNADTNTNRVVIDNDMIQESQNKEIFVVFFYEDMPDRGRVHIINVNSEDNTIISTKTKLSIPFGINEIAYEEIEGYVIESSDKSYIKIGINNLSPQEGVTTQQINLSGSIKEVWVWFFYTKE